MKRKPKTSAYRCIACANVSGALCDSGVVVPDDPTLYGLAVRELTRQRNRLRATLVYVADMTGYVESVLSKEEADAAERRFRVLLKAVRRRKR